MNRSITLHSAVIAAKQEVVWGECRVVANQLPTHSAGFGGWAHTEDEYSADLQDTEVGLGGGMGRNVETRERCRKKRGNI